MNIPRTGLVSVAACVLLALGTTGCVDGVAQEGAYVSPRTADGLPDLQGIWQVMNAANVNILAHSASSDGPAGQSVVEGGVLPYQDWAVAKQQENYANRHTLDTERRCHLAGVPRATYIPLPFRIVQTPEMVVILYEYAHMTRRIYTDGTPHQEDLEFYLGDSRGHYEGDTFVVSVEAFNDLTWFDGAGNFHSNAMKVVERFTRIDDNQMDYEATIDDPEVFTRPWTMKMRLYGRTEPNAQILDYLCYAFEDETEGMTVPLYRESPLQ